MCIGWDGKVVATNAEDLLKQSFIAVCVVSLPSLSESTSSGSAGLQQVSNFGLFKMYLLTRLINNQAGRQRANRIRDLLWYDNLLNY